MLPGFFLLPIIKYKGKFKKKCLRKRLLKNKTKLADLETFQSFNMTEDAKINGSQARFYPGY